MSDHRDELQGKFNEAQRFANFGEVLIQMHVKGFRCHTDTVVEIKSPITAFCGLNGTGKSTLLQLAAVAYGKPSPDVPPYYINYFLVVGTLDPAPFTDDARVEYKFWQADRSFKSLTISRRSTTTRWSGYTRRSPRQVLFAGIGLYLPRIEIHDFCVRYANKLAVVSSEDVAEHIRQWTCRVLGRNYDHIHRNTMSYKLRKETVVSVERSGRRYSESHMGYGEGRTQYLITTLEALPERSLILIEEPETSLHPHAQREFGHYLVNVASRRGHQILLTTHSEEVLAALPSQSPVYLHSEQEGVEVIYGLTAVEAKSLMTEGRQKALNILVEDNLAVAVLTELIRRVDSHLLSTLGIHRAGSESAIRSSLETLKAAKLPIAAVLDADQSAKPDENIFKLPGSRSPEHELFASPTVSDYVQSAYGISLQDFCAALAGVEHHSWCSRLSQRLNTNESALKWELARAYATGVPVTRRGFCLLRESFFSD
jgi:predicted ATPase